MQRLVKSIKSGRFNWERYVNGKYWYDLFLQTGPLFVSYGQMGFECLVFPVAAMTGVCLTLKWDWEMEELCDGEGRSIDLGSFNTDNPDTVCYVTQGGCYTVQDLIEECYYNKNLAKDVLSKADWRYVDVAIDQIEHETKNFWRKYWGFVKAGTSVVWHDPDHIEKQGPRIMQVIESPIDQTRNVYGDDIVLLSDGTSEAEVYLSEIEEITK